MFEVEYGGFLDGIEDSKEYKVVRGVGQYTFKGKFESDEPTRFSLAFNCTTACQAGILGNGAKIQLVASLFINDVYVKELTHFITIAANLKKKYDDYMQTQWDAADSDEEDYSRSRKRKRTSSAMY